MNSYLFDNTQSKFGFKRQNRVIAVKPSMDTKMELIMGMIKGNKKPAILKNAGPYRHLEQ